MIIILIDKRRRPLVLVGAQVNPTQPAALWDAAPAPTCEIHQRRYQCSWHLCLFFYLKPIYEGETGIFLAH